MCKQPKIKKTSRNLIYLEKLKQKILRFDCVGVYQIINISSAMMDEDCMFLSTGAASLVRSVQVSGLLGRSLEKEMPLFYI